MMTDITAYYTDVDSGWKCKLTRWYCREHNEHRTAVTIYDENDHKVIHSVDSEYDALDIDSARQAIADAFILRRYWERKGKVE
jgi:hypothetical protein